jgi:Rrf2 family protein
MLKPSKKIEYALMALKYMSQKDRTKLTSAREICERFKTPFDTTAKVMQVLNNAHILQSVKGVKGGYTLLKDLSTLSYYDLTYLIEGPSFENHCVKDKQECTRIGLCNITKSMNMLDRQIGEFLKGISVEDIISERFLYKHGVSSAELNQNCCHKKDLSSTNNHAQEEVEEEIKTTEEK